MKDLIQALQILNKYGDPEWPTHCEHDELFIMIDPSIVSKEDKKILKKLGIEPSEDGETFHSFKFGSA